VKAIITRKEELGEEYDRLEKELTDINRNLYSIRWSAPTKESLQEYEHLLTRKTHIEKRMREITREMTKLPKDRK